MMQKTSTFYNAPSVPNPENGVWNLPHTGALYKDTFFNAPSVPQHLVPESTPELSDLFDNIASLTEQVKRLQDSVNQTMRSDSDCSTYDASINGANDERVPSETSETSSHDLDNMWGYGQMGNTLIVDNKLA
jgi:hypothetical protein